MDDILIVGQNISRIETLKKQLSKFFSIKDVEPTKHILGMKIIRDRCTKMLWLFTREVHKDKTSVV